MRDVVALLRPLHWSKNLLVLAPLVFAARLADPPSLARAFGMFASFCLLASSGYALNDLVDRHRDRHHPDKQGRPIASGRIGPAAALVICLGLATAGFLLAVAVERASPPLFEHGFSAIGPLGWAVGYFALTLTYSFLLKRLVFVDVLALASCFILRTIAGSAALQLQPSRWLLACGFCLALFLALGKRRSEVSQLGDGTRRSRPMLLPYRLDVLDAAVDVAALLAVGSYAFYTLAADTVAHIGSRGLVFTVPMVAWLVARHRTQLRSGTGSDPVAMLLGDRLVVAVFVAWCAVVLAVVYWSW